VEEEAKRNQQEYSAHKKTLEADLTKLKGDSAK
jgi:hypothetical protein